ncbi:hypothetical protein Mal4_31510 [Maioricimonas rarisocia]|uniref:Methyltransferase FkbM domain-containing protein n=1 Tax=Maioricimonas rarisocia TaxID=2528026 RepID=A0A517Z8Q8_9PLAN|nr:hypothetical protein [Maioricimonas rarisocia]QDU38821.1 hypothetical protein Mal4_31510 [Maioricimonas rarisocia]
MTGHLRQLLYDYLPMPALSMAVELSRRLNGSAHQKAWSRIDEQLGYPRKVLQGPFRGLDLIDAAAGMGLLPKVLGTYEREVWSSVESIVAARPDGVINVGAADGYYAVGLARRLPESQIVCFELNRYARHLLELQARRNDNAGRLTILGRCEPEGLAKSLADLRRPAVLCDCEGFEEELLDPERVPGLTRCRILVELHNSIRPDVDATIRERFAATHTVSHIEPAERSRSDLPSGVDLSDADVALALNEGRTDPTGWFDLVPVADAPRPAS